MLKHLVFVAALVVLVELPLAFVVISYGFIVALWHLAIEASKANQPVIDLTDTAPSLTPIARWLESDDGTITREQLEAWDVDYDTFDTHSDPNTDYDFEFDPDTD